MGKVTGNPRGRPPGAKNRHTEERERAMAAAAEVLDSVIDDAFKGDAHALLMAVYKNPLNELNLRIDAAKAAIRYEKPAMSSVDMNANVSGEVKFQRVKTGVDRD